MDNFWSGKTVVVTGAAQGQGAEEVCALFGLGAHVIALDIHDVQSESWSAVRARCTLDSSRLTIRRLDVSDERAWEAFATELGASGIEVHGLINNAGITLRKTVTETSAAEWRHVMSINLDGAFLGTHFVSRVMSDSGAIVNVASVTGLTGYFSAAYSASKWGLRGLTRAAALELANRNIRVNCICPGMVDTPMMHNANAQHDERKVRLFHEGNRQATPLSRGAHPGEIAKVAVFLLGTDASFITATDVPVDGGMAGGGIFWRIGKMTENL
ncbi:SDR family NAD(P)-dependent oxidoreductase [Burkholderia multivorans]|uniref:SDR family NAD(P)-dependent oxidoreductase n=1 Tax=Burkholderia multivorans TaxID=87883 RepID=UPI000D006009|nr:SDR family NAD(P)-dependent oxidoreductase [Burkholderia multivorans]MBH9662132.1 SDR family oxidoreductase [Burkholderia multivorans]MBU9650210.1 SDR family oxidoreductase [Burkholderia multivorans]PRG16941.1 short-chain dehydrogenase [Burkholderia multivorans]